MNIDIFEEMEKSGTEQIIFNYDKTTGLKAIMVINDTTLGPAMGGCRMRDYENTDQAILDAIQLALGMTYKCSITKSNYGGGKTVIIGDPKTDKNPLLFKNLGRFVQTLQGRYYMGTDVGTSGEDLVHAFQETEYLVSLPEEFGGFGNSAIPTAYGIYMGIKASAKFAFGDDSLKNLTIAVQGTGTVGTHLVKHLLKEEAKVIVTNRGQDNLQALVASHPEIKIVDFDKIYEQDCHIFSPCALGGIINDETIPKFKCKIIAGSANNQLAQPRHGQALHDKGIIYVPDFVINSGGFISASDPVDMKNINYDRVMAKTGQIYNFVLEILQLSKEKDMPTSDVAEKVAEDYIENVAQIKRKYVKY